MRKKLDQPDQNWVACAVCLTQKGKRVPAEVIANGYSVCAEHVTLVTRKGFSIFSLQAERSGV